MPNSSSTLEELPGQGTAIETYGAEGQHAKEFTKWMTSNLPYVKWVVECASGGNLNLIVYESTEDPKKLITYIWENFGNDSGELDSAYEYALEVMKAFNQPIEKPLTCTDNLAELMFYARKEGYKVQWIISMHAIPHLHQFIMTGPDGYKFETKITNWHPNCWLDTKVELERIRNKDFGFTYDKENKEATERMIEDLRKNRRVHILSIWLRKHPNVVAGLS